MQAAPHLLHLLHEQPQLLVEAAGPLRYLARVLVLPLVAPQVLYGAQRHHQVGGAHQQDVVFQPVAHQGRVRFQGSEEGRLHRHEHQHIVQGAHPGQLLVILAAQLADMVAHRGDVLLERHRLLQIVSGVVPALIGGQRHLGVDDDVLLLGQVDDDVGLVALALVHLDVDLGVVLMPLAQAALGEDPRQHHLPPVALLLAVALEGPGQRRRLFSHAGVELGKALQLELEVVALGRLLGVGLSHLAAKALQLLLEWSQQEIHAVLIQFAEVAGILFKDTIGEVLELLAEALFSLLLQLQLLGAGDALAAQGRLGFLETGGELEQQGLLLIQLLLSQHLLVLQRVPAILQPLITLLQQQRLFTAAAPPPPPAEQQRQPASQHGRPPGQQRGHRRPRWRRKSSR